jgi:1-acyl-sn-glycerol-3-phosphate acyltransferase
MRPYYSACRSLARIVLGALTGMTIRGLELLPREGGLVIAANHISFWDPPLLGAAIVREMHFLAKEELFSTPALGPLIRSVNAIPIRRGAADLKGLTRAIDALKQGGAVLLFPEGSRMRDGELHPARPGVGLMAVNADVPIAPCYISGSNPNPGWIVRKERVRIDFGPPRDWRDYAGRDTDLTPGRALYQRIGVAVMDDIARLRSEQQSVSRGAA